MSVLWIGEGCMFSIPNCLKGDCYFIEGKKDIEDVKGFKFICVFHFSKKVTFFELRKLYGKDINYKKCNFVFEYPSSGVKFEIGDDFMKVVKVPKLEVVNKIGEVVHVYWIVGKCGCGKTRFIYENMKHAFLMYEPYDLRKYNGDSMIVIDDLDISWLKHVKFLKALFDYYGRNVCGSNLYYKKVYVFSTWKPEELFEDKYLKEAIIRRITKVMDFEGFVSGSYEGSCYEQINIKKT